MAEQMTKRLKADLAKAETELRKWQGIVDGFKRTIAYYEAEPEGGRATPSKPLTDAIFQIISRSLGPLHYKEVYSALIRDGITVPGENPARNVGAHLSIDERFENVARGLWDLKERVDNGQSAIVRPPEPSDNEAPDEQHIADREPPLVVPSLSSGIARRRPILGQITDQD